MMRTVLAFCAFLALAGCTRTTDQQHPERAGPDTTPSAQVSETAPPGSTENDPKAHSPATEDAQTGNREKWLRRGWTDNRRHFRKWREEFKQMHKDFDRIIFELEDRPEEEDKEEKKEQPPK